MAVLALGLVGSAVGAGIGGTILGVSAAAIGGYIGATAGGLIDNILFAKSNNIEGPRLDDLSVTSSAYGQPIPLIYGPQNRLAGNVIWSTGLIETQEETEVGGKGGGSTQTTFSYRISVAVAIGDGRAAAFSASPRVKRIWANGKKIFDLEEATTPPDDANADVGMVATHANGTHAVFSVIRFYQGTGTQQIDPTIEAHQGVGNTPAYRHTMYAVLVDLQLADFGNVLPSLEFELEGDSAITDGAIVRDMCVRAGVAEVVSGSLSAQRKGFIVSRGGTVATALGPLALAGSFDITEQRGQIRCVRRGGMLRATVRLEEMGCVEGNTAGRPEPIRSDRMDDIILPREASVTYSDPALAYQPNTQRASRSLGNSDNNLSHNLTVTLTAGEARGLADRMLWEAWSGRRNFSFQLSDRWVRLNAGDIVGVPLAGTVLPVKIQRATRGANGVIEVDARLEDPEIYNSQAPGMEGVLPANPVQLPGLTQLVLMDAPLLIPGQDDEGYYWAVTAESAGWRGAQILRSTDGGVVYTGMADVGVRAAVGGVADGLPDGPADYWDRGNVLTVELVFDSGALESLEELAVLSGRNAAWLGTADGQGGEVIQFATAALVSTNTYELRDLLRGRLGTEHAIAGHGPDEVFVLLNPNSLRRSNFGAGDWDRERLFKPVSILSTEADTAAQAFTNTGESKRPLAPVHVRGRRATIAGSPPAATEDVTISWLRRSRHFAPGMGYGPLPLAEETEAYEVDIIVGGNVVNTYAVTEPELFYTEAAQTADGVTPGMPVTVRIYQLSAARGRGRPAEATV